MERKFHKEMSALNDLQELTLLTLKMTDVKTARFECGMIGSLGTKFNKIQELNVMNWEQAMMDSRRDKILEGAKVEKKKLLKYKVGKEVHASEAISIKIIDKKVAVKPFNQQERREQE